MSFRITNKVRNAVLVLLSLAFLLAPLAAMASTRAMVSIRADWWYQQYQTTRNWGTSYTTGGLLFGTPPTSALPVTPSGACPVVTASTPCTASWGTASAAPGLGTTWPSACATGSYCLTASVGTGGDSVFVKSGAVSSLVSSSYVLPSTYHIPGYPTATRYYSYFNLPGYFYKSNSNAPTTTTTLMGPTTTTRSNNNYAFSRGGSIKITPGVNRFGGTMRFYFAPGGYFYKGKAALSPGFASYKWNAVRTKTNNGNGSTRNTHGYASTDPQRGPVSGVPNTYTYGSTQQTHTTLQTPGGEFVKYQFWAFSSIVPWTTGKAEVYQSLGYYKTTLTATGYDNRTSQGLSGQLSLVQPLQFHNYRTAAGEATTAPYHTSWIRQAVMTFLPEPGAMALLGVGILGVGGLYRVRKS